MDSRQRVRLLALSTMGAVLFIALLREEIGLSRRRVQTFSTHWQFQLAPRSDCQPETAAASRHKDDDAMASRGGSPGKGAVDHAPNRYPPGIVNDFVDRPLHTDTLTASLPPWLFKASVMARFQRANSDLWTPRPDVGPGPLSLSRSQGDEDNYAYNHFFFGRGNGTFLEMGASRFKLSP